MRKKIGLRLLAVLLMTAFLCGCDSHFMNGDRQLMRPPYPAGEEKTIQEQLTKNLGSFTLKYPKSGSYRSAILQTDLTGDGKDDALVFYRKDESSPTSLAFLSQTNGKWQFVSNKEGEGGEVERVLFGDINNDGRKEVIVGWTIYSTGLNIISTYCLRDGSIAPIEVKEFSEAKAANISVAYTDMQIYDFDNDGCDEIIASYINLSDVTGTAKLIEWHSGVDNTDTMSVTDTAVLDGHVLYYAETKVAKLTDDKTFGVVLDGYKDNSTMITEYIYWDSTDGDLKTPFYNSDELAVTETARNVNIASRDVDFDGVMDIPVTSYLPGYDETSENPMYLTSWSNVVLDRGGHSFVNKKKSVINLAENYSIAWQSSWDNNVTCRIDEKSRILYFYRYQKDRFAFSEELLRIRVFSAEEWAKETIDSRYTVLLAQENGTVYAAFFTVGQDLIDQNAIASYFTLI